MSEEQWEEICEIAGDLQAEILRGLLEAQGIQVWLSQEGSGHSALVVTVGAMGTVHILVPASQSQAAMAVLNDYEAGKYEGTTFTNEAGEALPPEAESPENDEAEEEDKN